MSEQVASPMSAPAAVDTPAPIASSTNDTKFLDTALGGQPNFQQATQEAPKPEAPKAPEKKRIKQLKYKVDQQEFTEDLPFEIDEDQQEYMAKQLSRSKKMDKSVQSEHTMKQQVEAFAKALKSDTKAVLKELGIDPKDFAREVVEEEIKNSQMTPEQLKLKEKEEQLERLLKEREDERAELTARERAAYEAHLTKEIESEMISELTKAQLPQDRDVMKRIADYMVIGLQHGVKVTPADVIPIVQKEIYSQLQHFINVLGDDKVEEFIGKNVLAKIRKKNVAKAKAPTAASATKAPDIGKTTKTDEKQPVKQTVRNFFGRL